MISQWAVS